MVIISPMPVRWWFFSMAPMIMSVSSAEASALFLGGVMNGNESVLYMPSSLILRTTSARSECRISSSEYSGLIR